MAERISDAESQSQDVQHLHGEINSLKSEMNNEFERLHEGIAKIQLSLPEKVVYNSVEEKAQAYWKRNISLIGKLLAVWALVSYVCGILLAIPFESTFIGQIPLGFWFAQQGSIVTFIVLIWIYARQMDKLDREFDLYE
jgi:putative solute:sodium symporter small subunit